MIVVADASPVCYLILIGEIEVLPKLFTQIWLTREVLDELLDDGAPSSVRT
jgi:predicted nucleic acid-binding protein